MRALRICAMGLLAAGWGLAQTVEGTVFDAATGAGVAGVKVELLRSTTPFFETATDGGGRFRFEGLRETDYAVRYQSPDYFLTAGPSDYKVFHVTAAAPVKLEVRLMPWSRISGRVVDGRGHGVAKAQLELTGNGLVMNGRTYLRTSWGGGGGGALSATPMDMAHRGSTDAEGRFTVQVMPGSYRLAVIPPEDLKAPEAEADGEGGGAVWVRTVYPSKIMAPPAGEASGIELKLVATPARTVRGVVLGPDGEPSSKAVVRMGEAFHVTSVKAKEDGTFELPAVPVGERRIWAEEEVGEVRLRGGEWVVVAGHDIDGLKLRLAHPLTLRGRVVVEGAKDAAPLQASPMILSQVGGTDREGDFELAGAILNPDPKGGLAVMEAYPGVYRLGRRFRTAVPVPPPYYLDAVQVGEVDLTVQEAELAPGGLVTVVYRGDGGSVRGKVEGCAAGGVLLVSSDVSRRESYSAPCGESGYYEVRGVRPGEYVAVAMVGNGPAEADEGVMAKGVKVTVRAGEASVVDLRVATRPVY